MDSDSDERPSGARLFAPSSSPLREASPKNANASRRVARPRYLGDSDDGDTGNVDYLFGDVGAYDHEDHAPATFDPLDFNADHGSTSRAKGKGKEKRVDDGEAEDVTIKPKRRVVKLDETRLLSNEGFPTLIAETKKFKFGPKGNEMTDLKRLLKMYQLWQHRMYPKTNFVDTTETIEKLCHKRRMQTALKEWKDEEFSASTVPLPLLVDPVTFVHQDPDHSIGFDTEVNFDNGDAAVESITRDEGQHVEDDYSDFDIDNMIESRPAPLLTEPEKPPESGYDDIDEEMEQAMLEAEMDHMLS